MGKPVLHLRKLDKKLREMFHSTMNRLQFAEGIEKKTLIRRERRIENIARSVLRAIENLTGRPLGFRKEKTLDLQSGVSKL